MISNINSLNAYTYNSFVSGRASKLYVPVKPSSVIYAQFDHISGVAASRGQRGISIKKIQILNTLIEHLTQMKSQMRQNFSLSNISEESVDVLIETYQSQIKDVAAAAKTLPYALAGVQPEAGVLFSIQA